MDRLKKCHSRNKHREGKVHGSRRRRVLLGFAAASVLLSSLFTGASDISRADQAPAWVAGYQDFLKGIRDQYPDSDYGDQYYMNPYYSMEGLIYDLDHDDVPELIVSYEYEKGVYLYTYTDGTVKELYKFTDYVWYFAFEKNVGAESPLYTMIGETVYPMKKSGEEITLGSAVSEELEDDLVGMDRYYIGVLPEQLSTYMQMDRDISTAIVKTELLEDLLWNTGYMNPYEEYDYRQDEAFIIVHGGIYGDFPRDPVLMDYAYYSFDKPEELERDPLKIFNEDEDYTIFDGEITDWLLKNVFNRSDKSIQAEKDTVTDEYWKKYYHEGKYYSTITYGREGTVDVYIKGIKKSGNLYLIDYGYDYYNAYGGGRIPEYDAYQALMEYKTDWEDGYWSIYFSGPNNYSKEFDAMVKEREESTEAVTEAPATEAPATEEDTEQPGESDTAMTESGTEMSTEGRGTNPGTEDTTAADGIAIEKTKSETNPVLFVFLVIGYIVAIVGINLGVIYLILKKKQK